MQIYHNHSLQNYNTFGIDAKCNRLIIIESEGDIIDYFQNLRSNNDFFILGGGSNLLLKNDLGLDVLQINLKGKSIIDENENTIQIEVNAGENWHKFVEFSVENGYSGLENLALIPGNVGTAPIQNIGAYGVEQMQCFESLRGYNIDKAKFEVLKKENCNFGYRDSILKNQLKWRFIITSVTYNLSKNELPNVSYNELENYLSERKLTPTTKNIFNAVIQIRKNKLPSPDELGNSGSFFKNPIISKNQFNELKLKFPELKGYEQKNGHIKLSAGWLIEQSGLKGYRMGEAGVYNKHALILVNYGNATGEDVWQLAEHIIQTVYNKFQVKLEPEVCLTLE